MDILIISRGYPSEDAPMNGLFEWDQARALQEAGHRVVLGAVDLRSFRHRRPWGRESRVLDRIPLEVVHFPAGRIPPDWLQILNTRAVQDVYRRTVRDHFIPQVVHSHFLRMGPAVVQALGTEKVPLVHTEHFSGLNRDPLPPRLKHWGDQTYPRFARVIAVSRALAGRLSHEFGIEATVIPNPVDLSCFKLGESSAGEGFRIVSTGHLLPHKRMDLLIRSFHKAFSDNAEVFLTIIGEGSQRSWLEALIQQGPARGRIRLAGHLPREQVAAELQKSHLFALFSAKETFGLAYVEALACGLPILAANSGGPEDFIRADNGMMLASDTEEGGAAALQKMKENRERYNREAIAAATQETFSPQAVARALTSLYSAVLAES